MLKKFPPYSYIPGVYPHPKNNPQGHSYNKVKEKTSVINNENYSTHKEYIYSLELFNNGYYWEAHEELENIWNSVNRDSYIAEFLKALIKLCASGVKVRQEQEHGIYEHARLAKIIFEKIKVNENLNLLLGLNISDLINFCQYIMNNSDKFKSNKYLPVEKVFDFELRIIK
ncbi:MAG: hypothetical protein KatS3mg068_1402 [Candidatus Sericytochromatia bacterium]|nr:MAG: hypothetical protein KatS3mg068_1402 [Candidatus Sericytochromatia bacterium]